MKHRIWMAIGIATLLTGAAYAQTIAAAKANIPFDFQAGGVTLPAGTYMVKTDVTPGIVMLSNFAGKKSVVLLTQGIGTVAADGNSKLVFNRYGDRYFLSQVWNGANGRGCGVPKGRAERELSAKAARDQGSALVALQR